MDNKQNHRSPQRHHQPSPQTSGGMRDDADHPGNDGRPDRREREQDRANFASSDSEALRKTSHSDGIQGGETQSRNQRAANHSRERRSPQHQADARRSASVARAQNAAFRKVTQKNSAKRPANRQRRPEKCWHHGSDRSPL